MHDLILILRKYTIVIKLKLKQIHDLNNYLEDLCANLQYLENYRIHISEKIEASAI